MALVEQRKRRADDVKRRAAEISTGNFRSFVCFIFVLLLLLLLKVVSVCVLYIFRFYL
jgi:hypothetical protein